MRSSPLVLALVVAAAAAALALAFFAPGFAWDNDLVYGGF